MQKKITFITQAGIIAALYVVLTMFVQTVNLASGAIQFRVSEALCVLPFFTPAGIPGVVIGCFLSNVLLAAPLPDVIFGTLATAIGAVLSYLLRKNRFLVTLPPVFANALIIPFVLKFAYHLDDAIWFMMLTVGAGEALACIGVGSLLITALMPVRKLVFGDVFNKNTDAA
ncbi:MAG: QueT transporter family protein [Lachnospiraceae bacterium]|nr:QueT transporter family protein [Lachnospiraceae bacterium]